MISSGERHVGFFLRDAFLLLSPRGEKESLSLKTEVLFHNLRLVSETK
jgi:hypothetical protein